MEIHTEIVGEGQKFKEDGTFQYFIGNTIICDLSQNQDLMNEIRYIQERCKALPCASKFVFMPPDSIHMTVFELLCFFNREESLWSSYLDLNISPEETDAFFAKKLEAIQMPDNFAMKIDSVAGNCIWLRPADQATADRLRSFRDEAAQATGVKFPNHDNYRFHATFSYQLIQLTQEEENHLAKELDKLAIEVKERLELVDTGQALYTVFNDMSRFVPYTPGVRALLKSAADKSNGEMSK